MKLNAFLVIGLLVFGSLLALLYFAPLPFSVRQARTITVVGTAESQVMNEIARFSAGVNAVNDDKQKAVDEVNTKINDLIAAVKQFGIEEKDIKTQNLSINQMQVFEPDSQRQRLGQWSVNNTVEIALRDVKRANELTQLLSSSGANNVYGPNFGLENATQADTDLSNKAIEEARTKASAMAAASGARLGKVVSISEGTMGNQPPIMYDRAVGMGGGANVETQVGSTTVSKSVTVTFELN